MIRSLQQSVDLSGADRALTRVVVWLAGLFALLYIGLGVARSNSALLVRLPGVAAVGLTAGVMILIKRERLWVLMAMAAVIIVVQTAVLGPPGDSNSAVPSMAVVIVGTTASVFVRRRLLAYMVAFSLFIVAAHALWFPDDVELMLVQGLTAAVVFIFGSVTFGWLKLELGKSNTRYRQLFDATPVTVRVEDFSRVGTWLEGLRARGITDLESWLSADPDRIREGARRIDVVEVNAAGLHVLEAEGRDDLTGPIPEGGLTDSALDSFLQQFLAIWNDEDRVIVEVTGGKTLTQRDLDLLLYWNASRVNGELDLRRVTVAMVDVTDLRHTERNLVNLLRAKDEFVATISHELRTPLTAVVGLSEELRDGHNKLSPEEIDDLLALLASESAEVAAIVEDLLTAARADAGGVTVAAEDVNVAHEVASVLKTFGNKPVLTETDTIVIASADAARVRQVLRNLLVNAQRYGGPVISVRVGSSEDSVWVSVCDNGPPLPHHQREVIFERYFRARQQPGVTASVGLGLAVSRELAQLMEGDLTYHHDGTNSIFTLRLPMSASKENAARRAAG